MFTYFRPKLVTVLCVLVTMTISARANGADPKITKASHVQEARDESPESADFKPGELSYSPKWPEPPNTAAILGRLVFGTVIVIALCIGSLWLGKPWLQRLNLKPSGNPNFFIEASLSAGNRTTLHLIRVGQTQLVAGTDATGLKSLIALPQTFKEVLDQEIPEDEAADAARQQAERAIEQPQKVNSPNEAARATQRPFAGPNRFTSSFKD